MLQHMPHDRMKHLDSPERRQLMPPEELLDTLQIQGADTIVDIGAGTGYFAIPAAQRTNGPVYAIDPKSKMLEIVKERGQAQGLANLTVMSGKIQEIHLEDDMADIVIASLVLHGVKNVSQGLQQIHRILHTGGQLLCIEFEPKDSPMGPPIRLRIGSTEMEEALNETGFTVTKRIFPSDFLYVFVATR